MTNARFDAASVTADENGICLMVGPEGKEPAELRAEVMLVATAGPPTSRTSGSRRPRSRSTGASSRSTAGCGPGSRTSTRSATSIGGLWLAHTAGHEGIIAAHTIAGDPDVHEMDYNQQPRATYCRPEIASIGLTEAAVRRSGACRSRSARSRSRRSPRRSSVASTRASPRSSPTPRPTTRSGSTSSGRTPRTSSPRRRSASSSRRRPGRSGPRPTPTRRSPRSSARRPWPSTGGRSISSGSIDGRTGAGAAGGRLSAMAVTRRQRPASRRRARPDRRRPRRDVPLRRARPGRRRADVDPQPGRAASRS